MEQKIIATVGGHQITEAEVEAFIHSLPREQQAYAAHPDFRKQCEEQLIAVYAFAKYGEEVPNQIPSSLDFPAFVFFL